MNAKDFKLFMDAQIKEIEIYKWLQSEKAGRDLGSDAVYDWIENFSQNFYKEYKKNKFGGK
jgi:hypothetical protein